MLGRRDFMEIQSRRTKGKGLFDVFAKMTGGSTIVVCGVGGIAVFTMAFIMTSGVFMRYVLNSPSRWIDEITTYLLVVLVSLGLAYTEREGSNIRVDVLVNRLPKAVRDWVNLITLVLFCAYAGLLLYYTTIDCIFSWKVGTTSMTIMQFPVAPWQTALPLGLAILVLVLIRMIYTRVIQIRQHKTE